VSITLVAVAKVPHLWQNPRSVGNVSALAGRHTRHEVRRRCRKAGSNSSPQTPTAALDRTFPISGGRIVRPVDSVLFQVEEERPRLPVEVADTEGRGGFAAGMPSHLKTRVSPPAAGHVHTHLSVCHAWDWGLCLSQTLQRQRLRTWRGLREAVPGECRAPSASSHFDTTAAPLFRFMHGRGLNALPPSLATWPNLTRHTPCCAEIPS
jgi:hypothetical protein